MTSPQKQKLNLIVQSKSTKKSGKDQRHDKRIGKTFFISYFEKTNPDHRYIVTHLKNISLGGMCFLTTQRLEPGTIIEIELKTPFTDQTAKFEGEVLGTLENVANILYETRLRFMSLSPPASALLHKWIRFFDSIDDAPPTQ